MSRRRSGVGTRLRGLSQTESSKPGAISTLFSQISVLIRQTPTCRELKKLPRIHTLTSDLALEENMMKQNSRDKALNFGDSNTKYLYSLFKSNRKRSSISVITDEEGTYFNEASQIGNVFSNHFQNLLAPMNFSHHSPLDLSHVNVTGALSGADYDSVFKPIENEEIINAVRIASPKRSPGPMASMLISTSSAGLSLRRTSALLSRISSIRENC